MGQRVRSLSRVLGSASLLPPSAILPLNAGPVQYAHACAAPGDPGLKQGHHGRAGLPQPWPVHELWLRARPGRPEGVPVLAASFHSSLAPGASQPTAGRGDPGAGPPLEQQQENQPQGAGNPSAAPGPSTPSPGTSWLGRVQSLVWGQGARGGSAQEAGGSVAVALDAFAQQLGQARTFGSLATFGRGLPRGSEAAVAASLKQQQDIALALASLLRTPATPFLSRSSTTGAGSSNLDLAPDGSLPAIPGRLKEAAAAQVGCAAADVDNFVAKFSWFCQASAKVEALKAQGKPVPRTFQEVEDLMGGSWARSTGGAQGAATSRNAACPCGSGKKFKRCCGAKAA